MNEFNYENEVLSLAAALLFLSLYYQIKLQRSFF